MLSGDGQLDEAEMRKYFDDEDLIDLIRKKTGSIDEFPVNYAVLYSLLFVTGTCLEKLLSTIQDIENLVNISEDTKVRAIYTICTSESAKSVHFRKF